jgi:hypothetical protein
MRNKAFSLTFLLFALLSYALKAQSDFQPGYVLKSNGDTLKGFIDLRNNELCSKKCIFKQKEESQPIEFLPEEIKAYRFIDGKYYISKQVTIDSVPKMFFLEILVEGKANVYALLNDNVNYFFIEKEKEPIYVLKKKIRVFDKESNAVYEYGKNGQLYPASNYISEDNKYKGALIYYLQEDPDIREKVYRMDLDQKNLIKIAVDYHNYVCDNEKCIVYAKNPKTRFALGIIAGLNKNTVKFKYLENYETITTNSAFNIGFNLDIYSLVYKRMFNTISLSYTSVEQNTSPYSVIHVYYQNINLAANLYYCYKHYKIQPYAGGGIILIRSLSSSKVEADTYISSFDPGKTTFGIDFAIGARYKINQKFYTKLEFSYQPPMFEKPSYPAINSKTQNIFATLGIMYSF